MKRPPPVSITLHLLVAINVALGVWCMGVLLVELAVVSASLRHDWSELVMLPLLLVCLGLVGLFFIPPWHVWRGGRKSAYLRLTCCLPIVAGVVFVLPKTMHLEAWLNVGPGQDPEAARALEHMAGWAIVLWAGVIYYPLADWLTEAHRRDEGYPLVQRRTGARLYSTIHAIAAFLALSSAGMLLHRMLRTQPGASSLLWQAASSLGPLIGTVLLYKLTVWLLLWRHRPIKVDESMGSDSSMG
ncbi:hypothetical protein ACERK3_19020 [Phycisphaerales bacterium AB-hyl4]|uniref:Uncharacterized protein n=1 Tax=Natronomicrosphaera hydrolytica TaxID=3242702 RepID=A0ABV4UCM5_9BACT